MRLLGSLLLILVANDVKAQFEIEPSFSDLAYEDPHGAGRIFLFKPGVTILYTTWTTSTVVSSFFTICTFSVQALTTCARKRQLFIDLKPRFNTAPVPIQRFCLLSNCSFDQPS